LGVGEAAGLGLSVALLLLLLLLLLVGAAKLPRREGLPTTFQASSVEVALTPGIPIGPVSSVYRPCQTKRFSLHMATFFVPSKHTFLVERTPLLPLSLLFFTSLFYKETVTVTTIDG
jgi:hypothetical protein